MLFKDAIQSINFDQHAILHNIIALYCPAGFMLDPTFGAGGFYKAGIKKPELRFDLQPKAPGVQQADFRNLPLGEESIQSILFDPPFLAGGGISGHMNKKYTMIETVEELEDLYYGAIREFWRILRPKGILVFKCQDFINGATNHFMHVSVHELAESRGFKALDLFIKLNKAMMIPK